MKDNLNKIYIVTDGSYSEYHIVGVYSSLEKATHAQEFYCADSIEEYNIDEPPLTPNGYFLFSVVMDKEGNIIDNNRISSDNKEFIQIWFRNWYKTKILDLRFDVFAKDQQHAIKIANEKRLQILMNNFWPEIEGVGEFEDYLEFSSISKYTFEGVVKNFKSNLLKFGIIKNI